MTYAKQLKQMMAEQNINQKRLSELTGIGKSSISQYVSGSNEPSQSNREKIENVLGTFQQIEEMVEEVTTNVPIAIAAKKLGKSEQFVRVGLQRGVFDFGYAVQVSTKFTYHISPKKFAEYVGE